ncbi:HYR domain-containing protein [Salinimicrobium oceani]|uniref:HYR domain-containing protein n=1 Tax=Salinimicrobium oceani TaxID=2722702 RepID=A0ABX1CT34_9FLAO|nr:HYR domain-containing protein [Salinimicrobium oceani]NJW51453.1 HYR domain-containing protein [Salinimicrobium oceani]
MRRLRPIQKCHSTAVFLRHFFGWRISTLKKLRVAILFLVVTNLGGWSLLGQAPDYTHDPNQTRNLDDFSITVADALNPQAKINRLIIAVDVAPSGEIFVLTFGSGIKKVGPSGGLINFIPNQSDRLSNALDFAINSEGKFFVATNESNRRFIRVYSPQGVYLPGETLGNGDYGTGPDEFKGPSGLTFDNNDNLYVADHYLGDANPPPSRPSAIKIYKKDAAGNYKNNLVKEFDNVNGEILNFPYRIAINSTGELYMSELGQDDKAEVKIIDFDSNFNPLGIRNGPSANLGAPGSIIIDKYDYILVADFGNEIDLPRLLAATDDLNEFYAVFEIIKNGIKNNVFNINFYNPDNTFRSKITSEIDFPIDFSISSCGNLFVNNAIFDGDVSRYCLPFLGCTNVPDFDLDFDLEVYERSAGYDTEAPVLVTCLNDSEEELVNGNHSVKNYTDLVQFTDNCDDDLEIVQDPPPNTLITETTTITIFAVDDSGNESDKCTFQVVIKETPDTTKPVFSDCSASSKTVVNDPGTCGALVNYTIPQATDESGVAPEIKLTTGPAPGEFFAVGSTSVTYTATDGSGNTAECSFTITVTDNEVPTITCPPNITETAAIGETTKVVTYTLPSFGDNCPGSTMQQTLGLPSGSEFPVGETITNTFVVTDAADNIFTCSFTVTIEESVDEEDPVISCPQPIISLTEEGACGAVIDYQFPSASDNSGTAVITKLSGPETGDFLTVGVYNVVFEARDAAQNTSTCTLEITVKDEEPPVFTTCPSNTVQYVSAENGVYRIPNLLPMVEATDNCSSEIEYSQSLPQGSEITADTEVLITASDEYGNSSEACAVQLVLQKEEAPSFQCASANGISQQLDEDCNYSSNDYGYLIIDRKNFVNGIYTEQSEERLGNTLKINIQVYHGLDKSGDLIGTCNFEIPLLDNSKPQFTSCDESPVNISLSSGESFSLPNYVDRVSYSDNCGEVTISQVPAAGTEITQSTNVFFQLVDASGNTAESCSFPVVITPSGSSISCKTTDLFLKASGENTLDPKELFNGDVNDPLIEDFTVDRQFFTCEDLGRQEVTLSVHFKDGSIEECETEILVRDAIAPEIFCVPPGKSYTLKDGSVSVDVEDLIENIDDNCGLKNYRLAQNTFTTTGTKNITIIAEDTSGNLSECTTTIVVVDDASNPASCKPAIVYLDASGNATLEPHEIYDGDANDSAIDNLSINRNSFSCEDLSAPVPVDLTINYTNGTTASCTAMVTVKDDLAPVISCVSEFTIYLNEQGFGKLSAEILDDGSADNCGSVSKSLSKADFTTEDIGVQQVILTVTDSSGNTATCETAVTVVAFEEETGVTCPEDITVSLRNDGEYELNLRYSGEADNIEIEVSKQFFTCDDIGTQVVTATYLGEYTGSCDINVTVIDDLPPVAQCVQEITLRLNASGTANLTAEQLDLNSTDNCGISSYSLSKYNFTEADAGLQQVEFIVTDNSGNSSTCLVEVNVIANSEEVEPVECVDRILLEIGENGRAVLNPRDLFSGGSGTAQYTVSKDSFTCNELGENVITFNYSTPNEEGSCEITVVVEDPNNHCETPAEPAGDYIILYPNPSAGLVRFQTSPSLEIQKVEVFDMRGRFLFEEQYEGETIFDNKLDLRAYQSGVYSILIFTNKKQFLKRAIIRND